MTFSLKRVTLLPWGYLAQALVLKGENTMYCKLCGTHYAEGASVCPSCGFPINEIENWNNQPRQSFTSSQSKRASFCKYCGAHYEEGALRCPSCDSPTDEGEALLRQFDESSVPAHAQIDHSKFNIISILLAILLPVLTWRICRPFDNVENLFSPSHVSEDAWGVVWLLFFGSTLLELILAFADKNVRPRSKVANVIFVVITSLISLYFIFVAQYGALFGSLLFI